MKNAEKGREIWGALRCWALFAWRGLPLLGAIVFIAMFLLILSTLVGFYFDYADTLADFFGHKKTDGLSAGGHFARNLGFALLALGGIAMAAWRNWEMSRQSDAALKQAGIALEKIKSESDRIAGERFLDAIKMLAQNNEKGEPTIAARTDGIYILQPLANNYVSEYAAQVVRRLVAYVRENVQLTKIPCKDSEMYSLGKDVKAAFEVLAQLLDGRDESPEKKFELSDNDLDFSECDFSRLYLDYRQVSGLRHYKWQKADLRGSDLRCADFRKARMYGAQLQCATLCGANLEGALLHNVDFRGTNLCMEETNLHFTNLRGAILHFADMRGAMLRGADLVYADCGRAKFQHTDLRWANLSGVENLLELPSNQIWHSDQSELEGVDKMSSDRVWDLEAYQDCPYALAGVLRNYTTIDAYGFTAIPLSLSYGLSKAARKLLDDNKLPPGFSDIWRKRLEEVDPETGKHPGWRADE